MAITMNPYLSFPKNNCFEAMTFYGKVFGATPQFLPPQGQETTPDTVDMIIHSELRTDEVTIMASDNGARPQVTQGDASAIALMAAKDDEGRARELFEKLAENGQVILPLEKQEWDAVYGELMDQFGVKWVINIQQ